MNKDRYQLFKSMGASEVLSVRAAKSLRNLTPDEMKYLIELSKVNLGVIAEKIKSTQNE